MLLTYVVLASTTTSLLLPLGSDAAGSLIYSIAIPRDLSDQTFSAA